MFKMRFACFRYLVPVFLGASSSHAGVGTTCDESSVPSLHPQADHDSGDYFRLVPSGENPRIPLTQLNLTPYSDVDAVSDIISVEVYSLAGGFPGAIDSYSRATSARPYDEIVWSPTSPLPLGEYVATVYVDATVACPHLTEPPRRSFFEFEVIEKTAKDILEEFEISVLENQEALTTLSAPNCCQIAGAECESGDCFQCWISYVAPQATFTWEAIAGAHYLDIAFAPEHDDLAFTRILHTQKFATASPFCTTASVSTFSGDATREISELCSSPLPPSAPIVAPSGTTRVDARTCEVIPFPIDRDEQLFVVRGRTEQEAKEPLLPTPSEPLLPTPSVPEDESEPPTSQSEREDAEAPAEESSGCTLGHRQEGFLSPMVLLLAGVLVVRRRRADVRSS